MSMSNRPRSSARWSLQDAKNKLSEVVDAASGGRPQIVTRRGVETAVVLSYGEYERITVALNGATPSLSEYLLAMPPIQPEAPAPKRAEPQLHHVPV